VTQQPAILDPTRWTALWSRLGAHGDGRAVFQRLANEYSAPPRTYHNAEHLKHCLVELDQHRGLAIRPDEIEAALWFHDAIYVPGREDNESRSARWAESALSEAGLEPAICRRVAALVLATRHATQAEDPGARLICDIDLSILGSAPARFEEFERRIREEYRRVPEMVYRRSRAEVCRGFLQRPSIYQTPAFIQRYEAPARQNLEKLLSALTG
jgi:predicted metal-dependent HD superfamily phosphohydrolase